MENKTQKKKKTNKKKKKQTVFRGDFVCIYCGLILRAGNGRLRNHLIYHGHNCTEDLSKHFVNRTEAEKKGIKPITYTEIKINNIEKRVAACIKDISISSPAKSCNSERLRIISVPFGGMNKKW